MTLSRGHRIYDLHVALVNTRWRGCQEHYENELKIQNCATQLETIRRERKTAARHTGNRYQAKQKSGSERRTYNELGKEVRIHYALLQNFLIEFIAISQVLQWLDH